MKKNISIFGALFICLLIFVPHSHAQSSIEGWWKARMAIQQGHFETGTWNRILATGKHGSYLYIIKSTSYNGTAYLVLWDDLEQKYIIENYTLYMRNNIVVLTIPTSLDADGNLIHGRTIVLTVYGGPNTLNSMKGYYTLYDIETTVTPEQFVRMGPVDAYRVNPDKVPKDAADLVSGQPPF
jgi:hypothetical protein